MPLLRAVSYTHLDVYKRQVFQRLVKIGVESQDRGVFQRFRFVQIKALNLARLQPCQRYAQRFKVGNDMFLYIEAIRRVGRFLSLIHISGTPEDQLAAVLHPLADGYKPRCRNRTGMALRPCSQR